MTGMRGYGVYCRLVELCNATPQRKAKYDLEDFAYDMHEESEFVRQIAEDFNLFTIEDGTIADSFTKTPEFQEKERQEQIRRNRREGAKKAAQTRKAKKALQEQKTTVKNIQAPEKRAGGGCFSSRAASCRGIRRGLSQSIQRHKKLLERNV